LKRAVLAAAVLAAACTGGAGGASGARLAAAPASFDFGSVLPGRTLQRDIVLRNVGDADLVVKDVYTTCECTVVGSYAKRLAPGASTSLRVELTTPGAAGRTVQTVTIESNDPERPKTEVQVSATVVAAGKPGRGGST
jgi:hypothetical protein